MRQAITKIKRQAKIVHVTSNTDAYWTELDTLIELLREFLNNHDIRELSKPDMIFILGLCSSHRPEQPFQTLMRFNRD